MVIESYGADPATPLPVVAVYPKEGTFWSDHPVGIVQRDWVDDEHKQGRREIRQLPRAPATAEARDGVRLSPRRRDDSTGRTD